MSYDRLAPTISSKAKKLFGSGNMGQNNWGRDGAPLDGLDTRPPLQNPRSAPVFAGLQLSVIILGLGCMTLCVVDIASISAAVDRVSLAQSHYPLRTQIASRRRGVVVSGVRRVNEVNARRARLVPGWVTVFGRVYHLDMQQGQLSLASVRGRLIEYQLRLG